MNNVPPPPPPPPQPPYLPPGAGPYPPNPYQGYAGQPQPPRRGGGGGKCFLIGCLILPAIFVAFVAGMVFFVFNVIKSSDPYKDSVARARANPAVARALGQPIKESFFVLGRINYRNSDGDAELHATLSGPKDEGALSVVGTKKDGAWSYSVMRVRLKSDGEEIDLLDGAR